MNRTVLILLQVGLIYIYKTSAQNQVDRIAEAAEVKTILQNYDKSLRPNDNVIDFNFKINQIIGLNERNKILTTSIYIFLTWTDDRLVWSPQNINDILIPASSIWVPDLYVINTADSNGFVSITSNNYALVTSDGTVYLALSISSLNTRCDMDIYKFPYDSQK
jgi:hypothetical protein